MFANILHTSTAHPRTSLAHGELRWRERCDLLPAREVQGVLVMDAATAQVNVPGACDEMPRVVVFISFL